MTLIYATRRVKVFEFNLNCLLSITSVAIDPQKNKAWPQTDIGHSKSFRNPTEISAKSGMGAAYLNSYCSLVLLWCVHTA